MKIPGNISLGTKNKDETPRSRSIFVCDTSGFVSPFPIVVPLCYPTRFMLTFDIFVDEPYKKCYLLTKYNTRDY